MKYFMHCRRRYAERACLLFFFLALVFRHAIMPLRIRNGQKVIVTEIPNDINIAYLER